jgi:UDP-N-acetylmuramoyl-tripeptide--D-alanyl-D-alanine ligase
MSPKKLGKAILCSVLEAHVKRLQKNNDFKIIAVAGSVGKTTTKMAIAKTLGSKSRVCFEEGNYNDRLTVPLVLFNEREPGIFDIPSWLRLLARTSKASRQEFPYDYAVLELGSDAPGQLASFSYLEPDITVLTAISIEHMEYFKDMDAVAAEELVPMGYSKVKIVNIDDVEAKYLENQNYMGYGFGAELGYGIHESADSLTIQLDNKGSVSVKNPMLGKQGAKAMAVAAAVAHQLGWDEASIINGLEQVSQVAGRMQKLDGIKGSIIYDDTYNASPIATKAALDVLYGTDVEHRIAVLGSMNELGEESPQAHEEVGRHCDPAKLDCVITIGADAKDYLAPVAKEAGCQVVSFMSPVEAGNFIKERLQASSAVLVKGSQNAVFAEETVKLLLQNPDDSSKLVRQSEEWMTKKQRQFPEITF